MNSRSHRFGTLLLARHGETEWNRSGRIMGRGDSFVTPEGLAIIHGFARALSNQGIDRIVSSPLGRAALTACLYSQMLSVPLHFNRDLCELSAGAWQGALRGEVSHDGRPLRSTWYDRPPHGESYADAEDRVARFLRDARCYLGETVLIIGHAGINRVIFKVRLNLKPAEALKPLFPHDVIYRIDPSNQVVFLNPGSSKVKAIYQEAYRGA